MKHSRMKQKSILGIAVVILAAFTSITSLQNSYGAENSLSVEDVNNKDLMQGNDFYRIETFQSKFPPDSVLGWFQRNLPTISDGRNNPGRKDPSKLGVSFSSELPMALLSSIRVFKSQV